MTREKLLDLLDSIDGNLTAGAIWRTVGNARAVVATLRYLVQNTPAQSAEIITEHGSSNYRPPRGMMVLNNEFEQEYLADWADVERQHGNRIYRRRVIVVEDWTEVEP